MAEYTPINVGQLRKALEGVADDVRVFVRTDYYYELATSAEYVEDFTAEGPEHRGQAFVIEG